MTYDKYANKITVFLTQLGFLNKARCRLTCIPAQTKLLKRHLFVSVDIFRHVLVFVYLPLATMAPFQTETVGAERAALLCTEGPRPTVSSPVLCTSSTHHRTARYVSMRMCVCAIVSSLCNMTFLPVTPVVCQRKDD